MGTFGKSLSKELGKNTGKWISNKIFGDGHSTPHKLIISKQKQELRQNKNSLNEIRNREIERRREERIQSNEEKRYEADVNSALKAQLKLDAKDEKIRLQNEETERIAKNVEIVEDHQYYISSLISMHKSYSDSIDIQKIANSELSLKNTVNKYCLENLNLSIDELEKKNSHAYSIIESNSCYFCNDIPDFISEPRIIEGDSEFLLFYFTKYNVSEDFIKKGTNKYHRNAQDTLIKIIESIDGYDVWKSSIDSSIYLHELLLDEVTNELKENSSVFNMLVKNSKVKELESKKQEYELKLSELKTSSYPLSKTEIDNYRLAKKAINEYLDTLKKVEKTVLNSIDELTSSFGLQQIAIGILENEPEAFDAALKSSNLFDFVEELGSYIDCELKENQLSLNFYVNGEDVIPDEEPYLIRQKELSYRQIPSSMKNDIYQDYVCSSILRIGIEIFNIFPFENFILNVIGQVENTATGKSDEVIIISINLDKKMMNSINLDKIDPSDSISNFEHNMNYSKKTGFKSVEIIN